MAPNPYRPPATAPYGGAPNTGYVGYPWSDQFVPVGWRTGLAAAAIVATTLGSFVVDITSLALADQLKAEEPDLGVSLVFLGVALMAIAAQLLAIVFFSIWVHRAAKNLPALGRRGMVYTPGWCVGWFFIPFANLVKPFHALQEIWRASNADAHDDDWRQRTTPSILTTWWGTWIIGSLISNASARIDDPSTSGALGLIGSFVLAGCAFAAIAMMRSVAAGQARLAHQLGHSEAQYAPYSR